jgi:hypothetical protein
MTHPLAGLKPTLEVPARSSTPATRLMTKAKTNRICPLIQIVYNNSSAKHSPIFIFYHRCSHRTQSLKNGR